MSNEHSFTTGNSSYQHRLDGLVMEEMSGVDMPAHLHPGWLVMKSLGGDQSDSHHAPKEAPMEEINKEALDPEIVAYLEAVEAERDTAVAEAADAVAKAAEYQSLLDPASEEVTKAALADLPEPVQKQFAAMQDRIQKAEARAAAEEDRRLTAEFEAVAKTYENLSVDPTEFGPVLRKCAAALGEDVTKLTEVLKAADAAVGSAGVFEEIGTNRSLTGSAYTKLESIAKSAMQESTDLTFAEAFDDAIMANPSLYDQYLSEA